MTQAPVDLLKGQDFVGCLSPDAQAKLFEAVELVSFEVGQQVVDPGIIPGRVLLLLQGRVRLIGEDQGKILSLGKFEVGSLLGPASLMCGAGIENLIASEAVVAASIRDELWAEFYQQEESFKRWCDDQLWPSEIVAILQSLQARSAQAQSTLGFTQMASKRQKGCPSMQMPSAQQPTINERF